MQLIGEICGFPRDGGQLQLADAIAYGEPLLRGENYPGERSTSPLSQRGLAKEISIAGEDNPAKRSGSLKQFGIA
jgi:hypothetical protein